MSSYWFKNFCGLPVTDFELLKVPHPGAEFSIHVTLRSIQTGALLGFRSWARSQRRSSPTRNADSTCGP
ncbi:unnamed protein product, partial [Mesorhabditis spiculigera]